MQEKYSFLHKSVSSALCFSNEVVLLMLTGYFKKRFFTNSDEMLNFVSFKNLSNVLMATFLNTSANLEM